MELFTIKRYSEHKRDVRNETETVIKDKLLKKIEHRKSNHKEITSDEAQLFKEKLRKIDNGLSLLTKDFENGTQPNIVNENCNVGIDIIENITEAKPFGVLGEDVGRTRKEKAQLYLPPWLANPTIISQNITDLRNAPNVKDITYLHDHIKKSLKEMKVKKLFPVQEKVIPWILDAQTNPMPFRPRDICVSVPTGSGKTLAFAIPIVQVLPDYFEREIRALVVLPVVELAYQVFLVFQKLCKNTFLKVCLLSNKTPLAVEQETLIDIYKGKVYSKVDIVVTTPGRLVEHLYATKNLSFKNLKFLVIDEADRIMESFFQNWLYHLDEKVRNTTTKIFSDHVGPLCYNELLETSGKTIHKLLFSATLSDDLEKLQNMHLFHPKLFTIVKPCVMVRNISPDVTPGTKDIIEHFTTPAELTEKYCITETRYKPLTLYTLIRENGWRKFLCFTNSIQSSARLAFVLKYLFKSSGVIIKELSASLAPAIRSKVLSQFARGKINGLVCSDALARGIDVPDVDVVISYDPPRHIKTYIHRVGRTARAGRPGLAIALMSQKEYEVLNDILRGAGKVLNKEIEVSENSEAENANIYSLALEALRNKVKTDKKKVLIEKRLAMKKEKLHQEQNLSLVSKLTLQALEADKKDKNSKDEVKVSKRFQSKNLNKYAKRIENSTKDSQISK